jgi:hypothetical protein
MFADFITPRDPRWLSLLDRVAHDVYHLPEYSVLAATHEGGVPTAFYVESNDKRLLIPLLLRALPAHPAGSVKRDRAIFPTGLADVASPYGYPGPVATDLDDVDWLLHAFALFRQRATEHRIVTAFLRLHPLCGVSPAAIGRSETVVQHGPVVYIDLRKELDELWADTRSNHRRNIKRLRDGGFTARMDDWSVYPSFGPLYRMTMERVGASAFYFFTDAYFRDLRHMLGRHLHLCSVCAPNGDMAAAGLFTETNGIVEYHLAGTAATYLGQAPSKLMFDAVRHWSKSIGASVLHLGGGTGGCTSSLFAFKAGFGTGRAPFPTARMIFDPQLYAEVVRAAAPATDSRGSMDSGFFPRYRELIASPDPVAAQ